MSGIYIKGMKMPKNCMECFCINGEHLYCQAVGRKPNSEVVSKRIPDWCPLVEVLPHGRLIYADELVEKICEQRSKGRRSKMTFIEEIRMLNRKKTNADRIRNMTDEELINWLNSLNEELIPWCDHPCPNGADSICRNCVEVWVKQEAT